MPSTSCTLCHAPAAPYLEVWGRLTLRCERCRLTFVDPAERLAPEAERARYATHDNDPADPGYRRFLNRLAEPLVTRLSPGAEGLDYGSGPGPTLSVMLGEQGFPTANWDPFFAPDSTVLERRWDFVTCTETAEHFFEPAAEFHRLHDLLRPGGILAVMTQPLLDDTDFGTWWYARDPTHVSFYHEETFAWIAERWGWTLERPASSVAFFRSEVDSPPNSP